MQASTLRHRIEAYPNAPHGYYVVDDDRAEDELEVLAFFQGNDILKELEDLRQARRMEQMNILDEGLNVTEQKAPISTIPHPGPRIRYPSGTPVSRFSAYDFCISDKNISRETGPHPMHRISARTSQASRPPIRHRLNLLLQHLYPEVLPDCPPLQLPTATH